MSDREREGLRPGRRARIGQLPRSPTLPRRNGHRGTFWSAPLRQARRAAPGPGGSSRARGGRSDFRPPFPSVSRAESARGSDSLQVGGVGRVPVHLPRAVAPTVRPPFSLMDHPHSGMRRSPPHQAGGAPRSVGSGLGAQGTVLVLRVGLSLGRPCRDESRSLGQLRSFWSAWGFGQVATSSGGGAVPTSISRTDCWSSRLGRSLRGVRRIFSSGPRAS